MTQPPADFPPGSPDYPRQELLPQQVRPGRRRTWLVVVAAVVVVAVVVGVVVWRLTSGGDSGDRAVYCQRVRQLVNGGSVGGVPGVPGAGSVDKMLERLDSLRAVAPSAVRPAWDDLVATVGHAGQGGQGNVDVLSAMSDLRVIVADANSNCGTHIRDGF